MKIKKIIINKNMEGEIPEIFRINKKEDDCVDDSSSLQGWVPSFAVKPEESFKDPFSPEENSLIKLFEDEEEKKKKEEEKNKIKIALKSKAKMALINKNKKNPDIPPEILKEKYSKKNFKLKKGRGFQLTINETKYWPQIRNYFEGLESLNYAIACKELAPTTGHEHIHLYVQFRTPFSPSNKKIFDQHIEPCRGSPEANIAYIKKENEPDKRGEIIWEWGEARLNFNKFPSIKEVKNMGREEREELPLQYYNILKKIGDEEARPHKIEDLEKKVQVYYIHGPSGKGKTLYSKILIKKLDLPFDMVTYREGFWHGVGESPIAFYDDFRDSDMKPQEFIHFVDYQIHNLNIKGSGIPNKYNYIIITSIQDPQYIYPQSTEKNKEQMEQWMRRMKIIPIEQFNTGDIIKKYRELFPEGEPLKDIDPFNII